MFSVVLLVLSGLSSASELSPVNLQCASVSDFGLSAESSVVKGASQAGWDVERPLSGFIEGAQSVLVGEFKQESSSGSRVALQRAEVPPAVQMFLGGAGAVDFHGFAEGPVESGCELSVVFSAGLLRQVLHSKGLSVPFSGDNVGVGLSWAVAPDRYQLGLFNLAGEGLSVFEGKSARFEPRGRSPERPMVAVRLNGDWVEMLRVAGVALSEQLDGDELRSLLGALDMLGDSRIRFAPGAELAVFTEFESGHFLGILPLQRPKRGAKVLKKLKKSIVANPSLGGIEEGLLYFNTSSEPIYVVASDRYLLVGSNASFVREQLLGVGGTRWFSSADGVSAAGVHFRVDLSHPMFSSTQALSGLSEISLHLWSEDEVFWAQADVPGLREQVANELQRRQTQQDER